MNTVLPVVSSSKLASVSSVAVTAARTHVNRKKIDRILWKLWMENNWLNLAGPHPRSTAAAFTTKAPRLCRFEVRVFVHKSHRSTTDYSKCRLGTRLGFGVWPRRTEASHVSQPLPFSAELPRILAQRGPRWKPGAGRSSKHTSPACPVRVAHLQE